jgi:hypothetical protein
MEKESRWRDNAPGQLLEGRALTEVWPKVRVIHAQWKVNEPRLLIGEVTARLLAYAIEHAEAARLAALHFEEVEDVSLRQ